MATNFYRHIMNTCLDIELLSFAHIPPKDPFWNLLSGRRCPLRTYVYMRVYDSEGLLPVAKHRKSTKNNGQTDRHRKSTRTEGTKSTRNNVG